MENPHTPNNPARDVENDEMYEDMLRCGNMVIGMAYVPVQSWREIYDLQMALSRGTQFRELDKPFFGEDVWR